MVEFLNVVIRIFIAMLLGLFTLFGAAVAWMVIRQMVEDWRREHNKL